MQTERRARNGPLLAAPKAEAAMSLAWHIGDTRAVLATLPASSVDLVLTSPPFYGQRSYTDNADEIGKEGSPGAFVDALLDVIEQCRRVLRPSGSVVVELGDTYADKSLCLVPEVFRMALCYGVNPLTGRSTPPWFVRNVVRWCRPNPPVGALGDKFRPATTEMVIACTSRDRWFDLDAVRRPANPAYAQRRFSDKWGQRPDGKQYAGGHFLSDEKRTYGNEAGVPPYDWWSVPNDATDAMSGDPDQAVEYLLDVIDQLSNGEGPFDWWEVATQPYKGAHFAAWPKALLEIPIKAMCPEGGMVLDPFAGSGTTLDVACGHGRSAIGIDLNPVNLDLILDRLGMFQLDVIDHRKEAA
jgi:DNA modification methylase